MSTSGNRVFLNNLLLANKRRQKNSLQKKNEKRKNEKREIPGSQKIFFTIYIRQKGVKIILLEYLHALLYVLLVSTYSYLSQEREK